MKALSITLVLLGVALVANASVIGSSGRTQYTQPNQLDNYTFDDFVVEYKKSYLLSASKVEYERRKSIFEANLAMIKAHNANPRATWKMNVNQFADMTKDEFLAKMTGYNKPMARANLGKRSPFAPEFTHAFNHKSVDKFPAVVDWRTKGVVTPVKNQGFCGSCWAFAAAATYESHAAIQTGHLSLLSTQQLTSCTENPQKCGGTGGCAGAVAQLAFELTSRVGYTTEEAYPYTSGTSGSTGACKYNPSSMPPMFKNEGFLTLPMNNATALLDAVANVGPVSVSVAASEWQFYHSGIFNGCSNLNNVDVNHAVVMDGYGEENGEKYYIIRNSWGTSWGEKGYMRLRRNDVEPCGTDPTPEHGFICEGGPTSITVCGVCGVLSDSSFPTKITLA